MARIPGSAAHPHRAPRPRRSLRRTHSDTHANADSHAYAHRDAPPTPEPPPAAGGAGIKGSDLFALLPEDELSCLKETAGEAMFAMAQEMTITMELANDPAGAFMFQCVSEESLAKLAPQSWPPEDENMDRTAFRAIDGDGHIRERDAEIWRHLDEPYGSSEVTLNYPFFPSLDGFQRGAFGAVAGAAKRREGVIDVHAWQRLLDEVASSTPFSTPPRPGRRHDSGPGLGGRRLPRLQLLARRRVPAGRPAPRGRRAAPAAGRRRRREGAAPQRDRARHGRRHAPGQQRQHGRPQPP